MLRAIRARLSTPGALWALGLGAFLVSADNRAVAPMLPAIGSDFHVGSSAVALLITAYSIPYGLCQLVTGPIADVVGKQRVIIVSLLLFSFGTIGCGIVNDFYGLLLLRVLTGAFAAGIIPTALAQIGDLVQSSHRPRAIAFFMSLATSGQAFGILIGGFFSQYATYRLLFLVIGSAVLPSLLSLKPRQRFDPRREGSVSSPFLQTIRTLFRQRRSWFVYGSVLLEGFMFWGGFTFLAVYANAALGLSYLVVGLLTAIYSIGAFLGSRTMTLILGKIGLSKMPMFGASLMTAAFAASWAWESAASLCFSFFILGLGYSYCHSILQTHATELLPQNRATAVSVFGFSLYLGAGIGPMAIGAIYACCGPAPMLASATLGMGLFCIICSGWLKGTLT